MLLLLLCNGDGSLPYHLNHSGVERISSSALAAMRSASPFWGGSWERHRSVLTGTLLHWRCGCLAG